MDFTGADGLFSRLGSGVELISAPFLPLPPHPPRALEMQLKKILIELSMIR